MLSKQNNKTLPNMSQEAADAQALTGKAKKAKRSEERYKKNKKRKIDDTTQDDAPQDAPANADEPASNAQSTRSHVAVKKRKMSDSPDKSDPKPKAAKPAAAPTEKSATTATTTPAAADDPAAAAGASKQRFIVFIGNLPFTATTEGITQHFASIQPQSIRHSTEKGTNKSKGFAFLEFANYDRMKTCLKLFHHSVFDSGVGGERGKRRINVELTAGGGGSKSEGRKEKLKEKNVRLNEQRQRRAEAEAKQEKRKAAKAAKKGGAAQGEAKEEAVPEPEVDAGAQEGIHPARLAMLQRGGGR